MEYEELERIEEWLVLDAMLRADVLKMCTFGLSLPLSCYCLLSFLDLFLLSKALVNF